eukprot:3285447-Prorocentrum_lima.AAC.1
MCIRDSVLVALLASEPPILAPMLGDAPGPSPPPAFPQAMSPAPSPTSPLLCLPPPPLVPCGAVGARGSG